VRIGLIPTDLRGVMPSTDCENLKVLKKKISIKIWKNVSGYLTTETIELTNKLR